MGSGTQITSNPTNLTYTGLLMEGVNPWEIRFVIFSAPLTDGTRSSSDAK